MWVPCSVCYFSFKFSIEHKLSKIDTLMIWFASVAIYWPFWFNIIAIVIVPHTFEFIAIYVANTITKICSHLKPYFMHDHLRIHCTTHGSAGRHVPKWGRSNWCWIAVENWITALIQSYPNKVASQLHFQSYFFFLAYSVIWFKSLRYISSSSFSEIKSLGYIGLSMKMSSFK